MNKLDRHVRTQIIHLLCEGSSIRAITRLTGVTKRAVTKLLVDTGRAASAYQDRVLRNLHCERCQIDEIWSFVFCKQDNRKKAKAAPAGAGDAWTFTAICADSKLLITWLVGQRNTQHALQFLDDLKSRLAGRVQLTSDGWRPYLEAVGTIFGNDVDYAMLQKIYGADPIGEKRYSPAVCLAARKIPIIGIPKRKHINTSFAERQNLTMRMHMRRFTRLTNGFSKKVSNHAAAVALHALFYNFCRIHQTLKVTPVMAAGVTTRLWEVSDIVDVLEAWETKEKRERRPIFEIDFWRIGGGYFVRATLPNGTVDRIEGFASEAEASRWIKNESVVWLHERQNRAVA